MRGTQLAAQLLNAVLGAGTSNHSMTQTREFLGHGPTESACDPRDEYKFYRHSVM